MWRLDEVSKSGLVLSDEEKSFYKDNLSVIKDYYKKNNDYWSKK